MPSRHLYELSVCGFLVADPSPARPESLTALKFLGGADAPPYRGGYLGGRGLAPSNARDPAATGPPHICTTYVCLLYRMEAALENLEASLALPREGAEIGL